MAGGGIGAAIQSLKENRALLNKRKLRKKDDSYINKGETKLDLKKSTEEDMKVIREKIKGYRRQEHITTLIAIIGGLGILYFIFWIFIPWLFSL